MSSSRRGPAIMVAAAAAVLVVAGAVVWVTSPVGAASFGWFSYAPLADNVFTLPYALFGQRLLAAGLVVVGLLVAGVAVGFRWGNRAGRINATTDPVSHPEPE
ncbi:MAG: hypothetical protein ABIS84_05285 [Arachnia sp.]